MRQHNLLKNILELIIIFYIVDQAIFSIESRFAQFQIYENIFGFLFNFEKLKSLDNDSLKKNYLNLECFLTYETYSDIDDLNLFS